MADPSIVMIRGLRSLYETLATCRTNDDKVSALRAVMNDGVREILRMRYDPDITLGITDANILKHGGKPLPGGDDDTQQKRKKRQRKISPDVQVIVDTAKTNLLNFLHILSERELTGHNALDVAVYWRNNLMEEDADTFLGIFRKQSTVKIGVTLLNKAYSTDEKGAFITRFNVALGKNYTDREAFFGKSLSRGEIWLLSRKYDGIRAFVRTGPGATWLTRQGKPIDPWRYLPQEVRNAIEGFPSGFVLDGELVYFAVNSNIEDFQTCSGIVRHCVNTKDKYEGLLLCYRVFDVLTEEALIEGKEPEILSKRLERLKIPTVTTATLEASQHFAQVSQVPFSHLGFDDMCLESSKSNWEGLVLHKDTAYLGKRSDDILKVKQFFTNTYNVRSIETDMLQYLNKDTGTTEQVRMMTRAVITHRGSPVGVGSGWTQAQRIEYAHDESLIIGRNIIVQYFNETTNSTTGNASLRFPTFKRFE